MPNLLVGFIFFTYNICMDFSDFKTGKNDIDRRLDKVIRIFLKNTNLSEVYKLIRKGLIKINKKKTSADYRIQDGDVISIASFLVESENKVEVSTEKLSNIEMPEIVFENEHILIINKPYNINVHGDSKSLDKIIVKYVQTKQSDDSISFTPGPLHRLDKKTTGLLAFSKSLEGARWFTENIQNHNIKKNYYGLVEGEIKKTETWTDYISKLEDKKDGFSIVKAEKEVTDSSKQAVTIVEPIQKGKYKNQIVTLVEFKIQTGRKHQIRSQSSLHGHPLVGDSAYGSNIKLLSQEFYLHAFELNIPSDNPIGLPKNIKIQLSDTFLEALKHCEIIKTGL